MQTRRNPPHTNKYANLPEFLILRGGITGYSLLRERKLVGVKIKS